MDDLHIKLGTGETLFTEGDEGDTMFVIATGAIQISKTVDGKTTVVASLGPGEFLGEMSLINQEARSATGVATEPTAVMKYDKAQFSELVSSRPSIALRLIDKLAERLRETTSQLSKLKAESE